MFMWILNKSLTCWPRATRTPAAAQETDLHKQSGRLTRSFDFEVIYISIRIESLYFWPHGRKQLEKVDPIPAFVGYISLPQHPTFGRTCVPMKSVTRKEDHAQFQRKSKLLCRRYLLCGRDFIYDWTKKRCWLHSKCSKCFNEHVCPLFKTSRRFKWKLQVNYGRTALSTSCLPICPVPRQLEILNTQSEVADPGGLLLS